MLMLMLVAYRYIPYSNATIIPLTPIDQTTCTPSLATAQEVISKSRNSEFPPNLLPVTASISGDLLTPTLAYLKIAEK